MYPSVRDEVLISGFPSLKEGLDALGLDAIEMSYKRDRTVRGIINNNWINIDKLEGAEEFAKEISTNVYRVSALCLENDFGAADLDSEIDWVISAVKAAARLGIPTVRIDAIMHGEQDMPVKDRASHFATCMAKVLDATSDLNIDMGIENHGFQGNDPDFLDLVLDAVGSPRVGMTLDTGNFYWFGHPISRVYEILEHFAPRTMHTHAKNIKYPADLQDVKREMGWEYEEYVSPLREGDIDHKRVVQILKNAGYDRDLCLEDESLGKYESEQRVAVLMDDANYFKEILK